MTFAEILAGNPIPKIKKDSPLLGYITGDDKGIFITICKSKLFGNILDRIRNFKQRERTGRYNAQVTAWEFPSFLLPKIRQEFTDLDDRTGDLEIPEEVVVANTIKQPEKPKFVGKCELKPLCVVISWDNKHCTSDEFQLRLDTCKKLKEKFGGRFDGTAKAWEINARGALAIRSSYVFKDFEFIGNFPEPQAELPPDDELTKKLLAEAQKLVNEVLPNGRTLFDHQKTGVLWMLSRPETSNV